MALDAALAYFHFLAIFILFAFLTVEAVLVRRDLDLGTVRLLGRMDIWYFGAAIAVLLSGFLRLGADRWSTTPHGACRPKSIAACASW